MLTNKNVTTDPSTTSATRMAPKGTLMWYTHPDNGVQLYRHGKAPAGGCTLGLVYLQESGSSNLDPELVVQCAASNHRRSKIYGVPQNAIAANQYGWFLVKGVGTAVAESATAAGAFIGTEGSDGKVGDASVSQEIGRCVDTGGLAIDASGLFQFDIM